MFDTAATLERIFDLLRQEPPDVAEALKLIKELMVKKPCAPELAAARGTAAHLVDKLVKPVLEHDPDRLERVDRLRRHLLRDPKPLTIEAIADAVEEIGGWILPPAAQSITPAEPPPPETFRQRLLAALALLGEGETWLVEALARLEGSGSPPPWEGCHGLLGRIVTQGEIARSVWKLERTELKETLLILASGLSASLQALGRVDGEMDRVVEQLRQSDRLTDLRQLQQLLLRESQAFQVHARSVTAQMNDSHQLLLQARQRLKELDDALRNARDEHLLDPATGLPNRFSFSAHLTRNWERTAHLGEPFGLLFCRLEGLTPLLEALDMAEAQRVAALLGKRIRKHLPPQAYLARLGPDLFPILLPAVTTAGLEEIAGRIHRLLESLRFRLGGQLVSLRGRFGGVMSRPGLSERTLLGLAHQSLIQAATLVEGLAFHLAESPDRET
ncbi:MAG: diguanylate cyclase [Magnetococcales bacterium]|nr:diguanylate cyclase [Magnetococcales bacterium]